MTSASVLLSVRGAIKAALGFLADFLGAAFFAAFLGAAFFAAFLGAAFFAPFFAAAFLGAAFFVLVAAFFEAFAIMIRIQMVSKNRPISPTNLLLSRYHA